MKRYLLALIFILSGCSAQTTSTENTIYTTVSPITDITKAIVGDEYEVVSIYPEDSDPHHYELTAQDMTKITNSELFIYISDSNNGFSHDLKESGDYNTEFFSVTNAKEFVDNVDPSLYELDEDAVTQDEHGHEQIEGEIVNPHVWVSPKMLILMTNVIADELIAHEPDNAELFKENANAYIEQLETFDKLYTELGEDQRYPIIVSHSAYNYLNTDYGIESQSLYGLVHEDEPTAQEIEAVIDLINQENIPAIYVEQNDENNKMVLEIANQTGVEVKVLNNMSTTSVDTLTALQDNLDALSVLK